MTSKDHESVQLAESNLSFGGKVDREKRVISGVAVLGPSSGNPGRTSSGKTYDRRSYTTAAMKGAVRLYEGARMFVDHGRTGRRSLAERVGVLRNVRYDEGRTKVVGDAHVFEGRSGDLIMDIAGRHHESLGLSHDAHGQGYVNNRELVVEELDTVHSVDFISNPATNDHLFEELEEPEKEPTMAETAELKEARLAQSRAETALADTKKELETAKAELKESKAAHDKLKGEHEKLKESAEKSGAESTKAAIVSLCARSRVPSKTRERLLEQFKGKTATAEEIETAVSAELQYLRESIKSHAPEVPVDGLEIVRLDEEDKKKRETAEKRSLAGVALAEEAFGAGADPEDKKKGDDD